MNRRLFFDPVFWFSIQLLSIHNFCLSITSVQKKQHKVILGTKVELDLRGCHNYGQMSADVVKVVTS